MYTKSYKGNNQSFVGCTFTSGAQTVRKFILFEAKHSAGESRWKLKLNYDFEQVAESAMGFS
jgi:hypothetical protein